MDKSRVQFNRLLFITSIASLFLGIVGLSAVLLNAIIHAFYGSNFVFNMDQILQFTVLISVGALLKLTIYTK